MPKKLTEEQRELVKGLRTSFGYDESEEAGGFLAKVFGSDKSKPKKKR